MTRCGLIWHDKAWMTYDMIRYAMLIRCDAIWYDTVNTTQLQYAMLWCVVMRCDMYDECVCVYVWSLCMYKCMSVWVYLCMSVWVYVCMCVRVYVCMCIWVYVCMCVWVYECMCVCVYLCICVCVWGWVRRTGSVWRGGEGEGGTGRRGLKTRTPCLGYGETHNNKKSAQSKCRLT